MHLNIWDSRMGRKQKDDQDLVGFWWVRCWHLVCVQPIGSRQIVGAHRSFPSQGMCLNQGNGLYKLQLESGRFKFNHCCFLFSLVPPPSYEAVETQLVCHCFTYVFCPQNSSACPAAFHFRAAGIEANAHPKAWSEYKNMEGGGD